MQKRNHFIVIPLTSEFAELFSSQAQSFAHLLLYFFRFFYSFQLNVQLIPLHLCELLVSL